MRWTEEGAGVSADRGGTKDLEKGFESYRYRYRYRHRHRYRYRYRHHH